MTIANRVRLRADFLLSIVVRQTLQIKEIKIIKKKQIKKSIISSKSSK